MITALARVLSTRPARERGLLAIMVFLALPAAFVALVALPLLDARDQAHRALTRAQALADWYRQTQTVIARLPAPQTGGAPEAPAPALSLAQLEGLLVQAGLNDAVTSLAAEGAMNRVLAVEGADFSALIRWLDRLPQAHGYEVARMALTPGDVPGTVDGELRLVPRAP